MSDTIMLTIFIIIFLASLAAITFAIYGSKILDGLSPKTMYRVASCLVVASILSGTISLIAILIALHSPNSEISNLDAIVDVLGILVTVLMGWNIISVVDFKRRVDKLNHITDNFQHVILGILRLNINSFMMIGEKHRLFDNCMLSLEEIMKCKDEEISKYATDEIMLLLFKLTEEMKKDKEVYVYRGKKFDYEHILRHIDSAYSDDIIKTIGTANLKDMESSTGLNLYKTDHAGNTVEYKVEGETLIINGSAAGNNNKD